MHPVARVLCAVALSAPVSAETLAIQGRLANLGGPVDGVYPMAFRLYPALAATVPTYEELDFGVPVVEGVFATVLGDSKALSVNDVSGAELWLELVVGTEPPLPRVRVSSVARAFLAERSTDVACTGCISPEETSFMACSDGSILVKDAGAWSCAPRPSGQQFALSGQTCPSGQVIRGLKADGIILCGPDNDTTYSGANFAVSGSGCPAGQVMTGVGADGHPTCAPDKDTTYSGANFAQSGQSCAPGQFVSGIDAAGKPVCGADKDTNTTYGGADFALSGTGCPAGSVMRGVDGAGQPVCQVTPTYTGANFALSGKSCTAGQVVRAIDTSGNPVCEPNPAYTGANFALSAQACAVGQVVRGFDASGAAICEKDANSAFPGCYTHWGATGCATGFAEVVRGRPGGLEAYEEGGAHMANPECVSENAPVKLTWTTTYTNRLMMSDADGDGMLKMPSRCSLCCSGGCYVALGVNTCATGYTATVVGRPGGVEAYASGSGVYGKTLCVDTGPAPLFTWTSGYYTRLMRHRETNGSAANGMDFVDNACAVCCKN